MIKKLFMTNLSRSMIRFALILSLFLSVMSTAWAIDVNTVIVMHKSGVPATALIATIKNSNARFILSNADLKKLKKAGVSDEVIAEMKKTSASNTVEPEPEPEPEPEADAQDKKDNDARIQEAIRREREKMREENAAKAKAKLDKYLEALKEENYIFALKGFDMFIEAGDTTAEGLATAKFGYAEALYGLGLYANALDKYKEILDTAPEENPVFVQAFKKFRECSRRISYEEPPGSLADHYIGSYDKKFQNSYNYFLGKSYFTATDYGQATLYLEKVGTESSDYVRAQYLLGLIAVDEAGDDFAGLIKANRFFQQAISQGTQPIYLISSITRIVDLSYLSMARIAYTIGTDVPASYDAALFYYNKISPKSTLYSQALYESAWAYFLKGNIRRGMGIFQTLEGPDWQDYYFPDTHLLEAQVFLNLCRTKLAQSAIKRLNKKYLDKKDQLQQYIEKYTEGDDDLFSVFIDKKLKRGLDLPRNIYLSILADERFYESYNNVAQFKQEFRIIEKNEVGFGNKITKQLQETARNLESDSRFILSEIIKRVLNERLTELENLEEQVTEMQIEIDTQVADQLQAEIDKGLQGKMTNTKAAKEAASQDTASAFVGDRYLTWPFEGEFWADEIKNYRSYLTTQCKEEE